MINGNLKGKTITVSQAVASGIFTRDEVFLYKVSNTFPIFYSNRDDYFNYVTILLNADANTFVRDASNNSFNITVNGDTKPSAFSPFNTNWSNYFDGNGDYLSLPDNAAFTVGTGNLTIEAWIYVTSISQLYQGIMSGRVNATNYPGLGLTIDNGQLLFTILNNGNGLIDSATVPLNQWVHVAGVRSGTNAALFVNGQRKASAVNSENNTLNSMVIGRYYPLVDNYYFSGYISNARLLKGTAAYDPTQTSITVPTAPLTAITNTSLLTCQSSTFIDNSTNAFSITKNGDVAVSTFGPFTETDVTTGSGYFDGTGDYLTVADNAAFAIGTGDFCIEGWYFVYTNKNYNIYFDFRNGSGTAVTPYLYSTSTGDVDYYVNGVSRITGSGSIKAGQWSHIAVIRSGTATKLFINGVQIGSTYTDTNNYAQGPVYIGRNNGGGTTYDASYYCADFRVIKNTTGGYGTPGSTITVPTSPLTAISGTLLLTLQNRIGHNNHQFVNEGESRYLITRTGNVTQGSFSPFSQTGWSNYFDGSGDYLTVADNAAFNLGSGDATIEAWIFPTSSGQTRGIIDKRSNSANYSQFPQVALVSGVLTAYVSYTGSSWAGTITGATPVVNVWTHVAFVRSGNTWTLYVNGAVSGTPFTAAGSVYVSTDSLVIGASTSTGVNPFIGYISNARIVKGTAYYTSAFTPSTEALTAISGTALLTCQSNRFVDNSTNAFTITRNGDSSVQAFSPFGTNTPYSKSIVGGSAYFDGTLDNLSIAGSAALGTTGDLTLEAWVYINSVSNYAGIFSMRNSTNADGLAINILNTGYFDFSLDGSSPGEYTGTLAPLKQWCHVALVRSGSSTNNVSCYLNGTRVGQFTSNFTSNGASNVAIIGRYYATGTNQYNLNGYISSLRYVVGSALYSGTSITVPTAPLTAVKGTQVLLNFTEMGASDLTSKNSIETVNDVRISTSTKKFGTGSLSFDGTGDYLYVPSSPNFTLSYNFTIEGWAYLNASGNYRFFTIGDTIGASGIEIYVSAGSWVVYSNGATRITGSSATREVWTHLAVVRSGTTVTLYINGTASGTPWTSSATFSGACYVGAEYYNSSVTADTNGFIDDFRVTNGYARYTTTFVAPTTGFPTATATS